MRTRNLHITFIALILVINGCALINPYISALRKIEKGQFDKASFKLSKIEKDTANNPIKAFVYTLHYKNSNSPFKNLDSAIKWAHIGDSLWPNAKVLEKRFIIRKSGEQDPFGFLILEIDSLGFYEARVLANENAFIRYLKNFPNSSYEKQAISIRDSIAFQNAKRENTYLSYKNFIEKYPDSKQAEEAREIYELLLFETHTRDKHKISYENFIKKFPHSPYLKEAEEKLFELYTLDYQVSSFQSFIDSFPNSSKVDEARLWIKHKLDSYDSINPIFSFPQKDKSIYKLVDPLDSILNLELDSIKNHSPCEPYFQPYLIYSISNKWGLADARGQGQIPALFHDLKKLKNDLYIYSNESKKGLVHVSGFRITKAEYDGFQILSDTFLSAEINGKFGLISNNGKHLTTIAFDTITNLQEGLLSFKKHKKWAIVSGADFLNWPDVPSLKFEFDSIYRSDFNRLIAKTDSGSILISQKSNAQIQKSFELVSETKNYFQIHSENKYFVYDQNNNPLKQNSSKIYTDNAGFAWKSDSVWNCQFYSDTIEVDSFDNFNNYYKKLYIADSVIIYSRGHIFLTNPYEFINTQIYKFNELDSFCFIVGNGKKYGLIDALGDTILNLEWDEVKVNDRFSIRVKKKDKYGLYDFQGNQILKVEFEAISNYDEGALTLFKNNKFGLIHPERSIYIKCLHENSIKLFNLRKPFYTEFDQGILKLYDLKNNVISKAKDFQIVNDSLAFFNQDFKWKLNKLNKKGEFEELGLSALRYRLWQDGKGNNHIIHENPTGKGFFDVLTGSTIYPEYFMIYPIKGKSGDLLLFYAFKYFEEIDLYLLKILDKEGVEIKKVLITADQTSNLSCQDLMN